jgi:Ca2+:H+ antiporter
VAPNDLLKQRTRNASGAREKPSSARRSGGEGPRRVSDKEEKTDRRNAEPLTRLAALWRGSPWPAVVLLAVATALIAPVSEVLANSIEPLADSAGLSPFFVGLIVLPVAGNAAEFTTALRMALRNRMEVTMAVSAGASIQVALLVAPVLVLASPLLGTKLDLDFTVLELVIFGLIAGLYALVSLDGESTWLEGLQLCAFYLIVAVGAFFVT